MTVHHSPELTDALGYAQGIGLLGARPIAEVIAHADAFVEAVAGVTGTVIDLGSGGGVPGLVIADARPDLQLQLVDRRRKRTDVLERLVRRLGWTDRVTVRAVDAEHLVRNEPASADAVVSRGFGPPEATLRIATALARPNALIAISDPPTPEDRWTPLPPDLADRLTRVSHPGTPIAIFRRT